MSTTIKSTKFENLSDDYMGSRKTNEEKCLSLITISAPHSVVAHPQWAMDETHFHCSCGDYSLTFAQVATGKSKICSHAEKCDGIGKKVTCRDCQGQFYRDQCATITTAKDCVVTRCHECFAEYEFNKLNAICIACGESFPRDQPGATIQRRLGESGTRCQECALSTKRWHERVAANKNKSGVEVKIENDPAVISGDPKLNETKPLTVEKPLIQAVIDLFKAQVQKLVQHLRRDEDVHGIEANHDFWCHTHFATAAVWVMKRILEKPGGYCCPGTTCDHMKLDMKTATLDKMRAVNKESGERIGHGGHPNLGIICVTCNSQKKERTPEVMMKEHNWRNYVSIHEHACGGKFALDVERERWSTSYYATIQHPVAVAAFKKKLAAQQLKNSETQVAAVENTTTSGGSNDNNNQQESGKRRQRHE